MHPNSPEVKISLFRVLAELSSSVLGGKPEGDDVFVSKECIENNTSQGKPFIPDSDKRSRYTRARKSL